jgi:hypothetical protein
MIIYTSSDIIKRATQLADLENSDFISFSEKIALLNESYTKLYQTLVNKGDNNFVRLIKTKNDVIQLPPDFWQLKSVTLNREGNLIPILRRPANQSLQKLSYELLNNVLKIYGSANYGAEINVEYYPAPKTLTFPNQPFELYAENIVDAHGDLYLTAVHTDDDANYYVLNSITDSSVSEQIDLDPDEFSIVHMEDDFITFISSSEVVYYSLLNGSSYRKTIEDLIPTFYRGKSFYFKPSDKTLRFVDSNTIAYENIECISELLVASLIILSKDQTHCISLTDSGAIIKNDGTILELKKPVTKIFYNESNDTVICSTNSDYVATVALNYDGISEDLEDYSIMSVAMLNDNNGYGLLAKKLNKYYIISYYEDTRLNFPNNMYFTLLAYLLAIAFKTKQGSDTSQLALLYEQAEFAFFDSLTKDDWNSTRITNVY